MGFNTTVVILNDRLNEIENDPEFGRKLVTAIRDHDHNNPDRTPYITGQTQIIGQHHADNTLVYVVGGNTGRLLGYGGSYAATDDQIIKELARANR